MPDFDGPHVGPLDAFALDDAGATSTCPALQTYSACAMDDPCAGLDYKDCIEFDALYNAAGRQAISSCYVCGLEGGVADSCVYNSSLAISPGTAQMKIAQDFCAACSPGATSACVSDFYNVAVSGPDGGDAGTIGLGVVLELPILSDSALAQIDGMCTNGTQTPGMSCAATWSECASEFLAVQAGASCTTQQPVDAGDGGDPGGA
jgi:hypothetical protein